MIRLEIRGAVGCIQIGGSGETERAEGEVVSIASYRFYCGSVADLSHAGPIDETTLRPPSHGNVPESPEYVGAPERPAEARR
jgi:hypothetical protein